MLSTSSEAARFLMLADTPEAAALLSTLERSCQASVALEASIEGCLPWLHRETFRLVLLEETVALASSTELDVLYEAAAGTPILEINFATTRQDRLLRQVQAAMRRQRMEEQRAKVAAARELRDELGSLVSGLLLQAQVLASQTGEPDHDSLLEVAERAQALSHLLRNEQTSASDRICIP